MNCVSFDIIRFTGISVHARSVHRGTCPQRAFMRWTVADNTIIYLIQVSSVLLDVV